MKEIKIHRIGNLFRAVIYLGDSWRNIGENTGVMGQQTVTGPWIDGEALSPDLALQRAYEKLGRAACLFDPPQAPQHSTGTTAHELQAAASAAGAEECLVANGYTRLPDIMLEDLGLQEGGQLWFLKGPHAWEAWLEKDIDGALVDRSPETK